MKRFFVPAQFIIHAPDQDTATSIAQLIVDELNKKAKNPILFLDNELPTEEITNYTKI